MKIVSNAARLARTTTMTALIAALSVGCASNGGSFENTMNTDTGKGALLGGATGALIGGLVDHADPAAGALMGAAGGALLGGLVGHHMDTQKQNLEKVLAPEINNGDVSIELLKNQALLINMTGNTRFAHGSTDINPAFIATLQKVASVAKTYGKITITVIGHPDKGGSAAERQRLSSQRAEAIRLQLIGMGVPSILVSATGNPNGTWDDGRAELVIHPVITN